MADRSVLCCEELINFTAGDFALKQALDAASSGEYILPAASHWVAVTAAGFHPAASSYITNIMAGVGW